jgi:hypothetical protein
MRFVAAMWVLLVGLVAGISDASAQVFDSPRIPTVSDLPMDFTGTWKWTNPRHDCGSAKDSYGQRLTLGNGPLCQWPSGEIEKILNGRGRAWREFANGDDAISQRWTCTAASLGTVLTENYLRGVHKRPDAVVMHFEQSNWYRWIWTDGRKHPPATDISYFGHSVGWMEGDTFVVETTNFTWDPDGYDDHSFLARSHLAKFTERYRLVDHDTLEQSITVDDPLLLTKPFTFTGILKRTQEKMVGTWDCDPDAGLRELYDTFKNPYPDDTLGERFK